MTPNKNTAAQGRFFSFLIVGFSAAVFTIAARAMLSWVVVFEAAVAVSHLLGLCLAFALNRLMVFAEYNGPMLPAYWRFVLVNLVSLIIATAISSILYRFVIVAFALGGFAAYVSHFLGLAASAIPSYFGHALFTFRNQPTEAEPSPKTRTA